MEKIMAVIELTEENFEAEIVKSDKPVLVDFWASWCGPCKMLSPLVDEISEETDKVKVCKVDVDEQDELAARFEISSIPTLILFKDGKIAKQSVGFIAKEKILEMIN